MSKLKEKIVEHIELITDSFETLLKGDMSYYLIAMDIIKKSKGTLFFTGIGKNGHVAQKAASTYASLGFKSIFINPVDAVHGDMGVVNDQDIVFAISKSGVTRELLIFLKNLNERKPKVKIIFLSSNENLHEIVNLNGVTHLYCPTEREAEINNIVPTISISNYVILLQSMALSMIDEDYMNNFKLNHPGGLIGDILKEND